MSDEEQPPDLNAYYHREKILGQGGFATTWLAIDTRNGLRCALKQLHLQQVESWKDLELFEREIRTLKYLDHPGVPRLLDAWRTDDPPTAVLVQEFVPGKNLKQWIEDGRRFKETEALAIALQLAGILSYLHGFTNPVIHRDLKPSNLMLDDTGKAYLIDFGGVAQSLAGQGSTVMGTFGYMPLEQIEGHAVPASDLYGLGATLVYLLTGQPPAELKKNGLKPDFRTYAQLSPAFARILDKLLEPELEKRYKSAETLHRDLLRLQALQKTAPSSAFAPLDALRGWSRVLAWKWVLSVFVVFLLLIAGAWMLGRRSPKPIFSQPPKVNTGALISSETATWIDAPVKSWQELKPKPNIDLIAKGPDGGVWGISDDKLYQFGDTQVQSWERKELTDSYSSLSFLTSPAAGEAWIGNYEGRLFRWQAQHSEEITLPAKLTALASWKGQPVVATGKRIWQWQPGQKRFAPLGELPEEKVEQLFADGTQLWASCNSHLYAYASTGWKPVFQGKAYDERVQSLTAGPQHLWLGLDKGLIELDTARNLMARLDNDGPVIGLIGPPDKAIWSVSTAREATGLGRLSPGSGKWRRLGWREGLPADRYIALLLDIQGNLWLSAKSGELWRAPIQAVEQSMAMPEQKMIPALRFENACKAWEGLRPENGADMAGDRQSGSLSVFWHQKLVCPDAMGFRRSDGMVVLAGFDGLKLWLRGKSSVLALPKKYMTLNSLLLGPNDDIWLGPTFPYTLQRYHQGHWQAISDFSSQYAPTLALTPQGQVLAATKDNFQGVLQFFDTQNQQWQKLNLAKEDSGLSPDLTVMEREPLKGQIAMATGNGLYVVTLNPPQTRIIAGLPYPNIEATAQDSQGRLWIVYDRYGEGRGLSVWDPATGKIRHLDSRQGLVPDRFSNLAFDSKGRLWLEHHETQVNVYTLKQLEAAMQDLSP